MPTTTQRHLDLIDYENYGKGYVSYTPSEELIRETYDTTSSTIEGISLVDSVIEVFRHNPETISVFTRSPVDYIDDHSKRNSFGFVAQLPLTSEGVEALFDNRLVTNKPDLTWICRQHETPHALYYWGIYTPANLGGGISLVAERLSSRKFRAARVFCKAANDKARRFFATLGFVEGAVLGDNYRPDLMELPRLIQTTAMAEEANSFRPLYDSFDAKRAPHGDMAIGIKVVHNLDELAKVLAIRSSTYLSEQSIPYAEDSDGNDLTATHLIGYCGIEPAGCLRIRYFADFVKFERLAVLSRFRHTRMSFKLIKAGIEFCRAKGYSRFYGHAEPSLVKLWRRFGFESRPGDGMSYLTDRKYVEGDLTTSENPARLTARSSPQILLRPEGRWAVPGVLELKHPGRADSSAP